jgi:hypothetical protein
LLLMTTSICIANMVLAQDQKSPYQLIIGGEGSTGFGSGSNFTSYTTLTIFLNNNTNDTLYYQGYRGSDCDNLLFNLKSNPYFHLADGVCNSTIYSKTALPPHRSQKLELFLTSNKEPDRNILLYVSMKLYKWTDDKNRQQEGDKVIGQLSDTIKLYYNSRHRQYSPIGSEYKKGTNILPNKDIYLLTDSDRKLYTLKIEQSKISKLRDTAFAIFRVKKMKRAKVITIPVTLQNNSGDTLRFYSIDCSWYEFWNTDSNDIRFPGWSCEHNIPEIITVAPHQQYAKNLDFLYHAKAKTASQYRISLSLLKVSTDDHRDFEFSPGDYARFNKIWSNEVTIQ